MKGTTVFGLLILLLISGSGFSFSPESGIDNPVSQDHLNSCFAEGHDLIFVNDFSAEIHLGKIPIIFRKRDAGLPSSHLARMINVDFSHPTLVNRGLGIAKIIFPFHSFL